MPKPRQPDGVPIWVSGTVRKVTASRVARFGVGWIPWGADAADLVEAIPRMRDAVVAAGGDGAIQVVGNLPVVRDSEKAVDLAATMSAVPSLVEAGVTDFIAPLRVPAEREEAEEMLRPIVAAFREATGRPLP
jgi:alkanesulfonate monooxygenase SsuD/methylene tetrahydromethanopterin reductase-like flavin-dependent oxidoreductase (luciferase family)